MDTFLYDKINRNIQKLKKKLKNIKQDGGKFLVEYTPEDTIENIPQIEEEKLNLLKSERNLPYYNLINFARLFDQKELNKFEDKHLTQSLKKFGERIKLVETEIDKMVKSPVNTFSSNITSSQLSDVKKLYTDYIDSFKKKVMEESLFDLDPDLYPAIFYPSQKKIEDFNKEMKKIFYLFDSSNFNDLTINLSQNEKDLGEILEKCNEFNKIIDKYIKNINELINFEVNNNSIKYNTYGIFLDMNDKKNKISEYDYTQTIKYEDNIDDIFTKPNMFNIFMQKIKEINILNNLGILQIPENLK
jgi:hypothetical protein